MGKRPLQGSEERAEPDGSMEVPDRYDRFRSADIALVEIAKLQADGEHLKSAVGEARKDMREARERLVALEVNVSHLPSKGFIVAVVMTALGILVAITTIAPQLQRLAGTATVSSSPSSK
jgi:hypothetical protein